MQSAIQPPSDHGLPLRGRWLAYSGWGVLLAPILWLAFGILQRRMVPDWLTLPSSPLVAMGPFLLGLLLILSVKLQRGMLLPVAAGVVAVWACAFCAQMVLRAGTAYTMPGIDWTAGTHRPFVIADFYFHPAVLLLTAMGCAGLAHPLPRLGASVRVVTMVTALFWAFALCYSNFGRG